MDSSSWNDLFQSLIYGPSQRLWSAVCHRWPSVRDIGTDETYLSLLQDEQTMKKVAITVLGFLLLIRYAAPWWPKQSSTLSSATEKAASAVGLAAAKINTKPRTTSSRDGTALEATARSSSSSLEPPKTIKNTTDEDASRRANLIPGKRLSDFWMPTFLARDEAALHESFSDLIESGSHDDARSSSSSDEKRPDEAESVTHFCFLVHGHRGVARDLWYMEMAMQRFANILKRKQRQRRKRCCERTPSWDSDANNNNNNNNNDDDSNPRSCNDDSDSSSGSNDTDGDSDKGSSDDHADSEEVEVKLHDIVVHATVCNERKTTDGVENGGSRLAEEMFLVIQKEMQRRHPHDTDADHGHDITISIVGNSLGGLYGRYGIAKFIQQYCTSSDPSQLKLTYRNYRIHLNIFCTTATPHLGVSRHTFIPIPRSAEIGVAHAMGETGRDLFRLNNLVWTMSTAPSYLIPLGNFRKRIAYANAYGTDFPVPTNTAAFLSEQSVYPHYFTKNYSVAKDEDAQEPITAESTDTTQASHKATDEPASKYIIATLCTPRHNEAEDVPRTERSPEPFSPESSASDGTDAATASAADDSLIEETKISESDELRQMSESLDRLGWKKIFLDMRKELPSMEIPESAARVIRTSKQQIFYRQQKRCVTDGSGTMPQLSSNGELQENQEYIIKESNIDGVYDSSDGYGEKYSFNGGSGSAGIGATTTAPSLENHRLDTLKQSGVARSKDLADVVAVQSDSTNRLYFPAGHNMMVAFSRSRLSSFLHKGGRPVVDALAKELVRDIFLWPEPLPTEDPAT